MSRYLRQVRHVMGVVEGVLVRWPYGKEGIGVIVELPQGSRQTRVRFEDGSEQIFATDTAPLERFVFQ